VPGRPSGVAEIGEPGSGRVAGMPDDAPGALAQMGAIRPDPERPGAEGPVRIAPAGWPSQDDSGILPGGIAAGAARRPARGRTHGSLRCLTPPKRRAYHPPDDERAHALTSEAQARLCASRGRMSTRGPAERIAHSPDEADLPAQEAASRQGARLPCPDEDARGASHRRCSAGPRAKATDGLTSERGPHPPRLVMLSRPQDFTALQAGTVRSHPLLSARVLRTDLETTRFGLATGRKLGGAVVRNRVRRRLREGLRAMAPSFQPGWDVLIIARPAIVEADHRTLVDTLRRVLMRAGVVGGQASS
jgi:ribonuclease P protein component